MKDGAYLLNTARGTLVDEQAAVDALRSGKLAGFAADVVSVEPMRADNPLLQAQGLNIVVTPHIAWATHEARARLLATVAANVGAFVEGHPQNVVGEREADPPPPGPASPRTRELPAGATSPARGARRASP